MSFHDDETVQFDCAVRPGVSAEPMNIPRVLGPVRLIREVGRGGMGTVWLGRHSLLARDVAVKFLSNAVLGPDDPHFERFLQEARTAASVRHPHLVVVHDADLVGQVPYLVMEYIDGPTLADVLRRRGPLTTPEALAVIDGVCAAVGELHQRGIVHRDIKPSNILLARDGRVVVSDFGLACTSTARREDSPFAALAGTPAYMAPEMFDGTASPRSDVYALGVTLFQLLTGEPPFVGTMEELGRIHAHDALPEEKLALHGVQPAVIDIIHRATNKNPTLRYKTAAHLLRALKEAAPDEYLWSRGAAELANEAARQRPMSAPETTIETRTPSSLSYYDRLSGIAATKRERLSEGAPIEHGPQAQAPSSAVMVNLPCTQCAYNLRGLPGDGACPECGTSIAQSLRPERLMFADQAWLRQVRLGLRLSGIAVGGGFVAGLVSIVVTLIFGWESRGADLTLMLIVLAQLIVLAWGSFWTTMPEPRHQPTGQIEARRSAARVSALGAVLLGLSSILLAGTIVPSIAGRQWVRALSVLAVVVALVSVICLMHYLRAVGRRIPDARLIRPAMGMSIVLGIAGALLAFSASSQFWVDDVGLWSALVDLARRLAIVTIWLAHPWLSLQLLHFARIFDRLIAGDTSLDAVFGPSNSAVALGVRDLGDTFLEASGNTLAHSGAVAEPRKRGDILRLTKCPQCEYSLDGLPRRYRCPECGFEYDESMFVVYGWALDRDRPSFLRALAGTSSPIVGMLLCGFWMWWLVRWVEQGFWQGAVLSTAVLLGVIAQTLWRRRVRGRRGGPVQFAFSSLGASQRRGPGLPEFVPWSAPRMLRWRRMGRDAWRLRLSQGHWRLVARGSKPYTLLGKPWIEGVIECDRRAAAALRGKIRRRLRAARE